VLSAVAALSSVVPLPVVPFCWSMPLVPAVLFGAMLAVALAEADLNFSRVLPVVLCKC